VVKTVPGRLARRSNRNADYLYGKRRLRKSTPHPLSIKRLEAARW